MNKTCLALAAVAALVATPLASAPERGWRSGDACPRGPTWIRPTRDSIPGLDVGISSKAAGSRPPASSRRNLARRAGLATIRRSQDVRRVAPRSQARSSTCRRRWYHFADLGLGAPRPYVGAGLTTPASRMSICRAACRSTRTTSAARCRSAPTRHRQELVGQPGRQEGLDPHHHRRCRHDAGQDQGRSGAGRRGRRLVLIPDPDRDPVQE